MVTKGRRPSRYCAVLPLTRARPARVSRPPAELADAGFRDIEVRGIDAPLRLASAADCLRFERESFGALHQMLSGLPEAEREAAWAEVGEALTAFEGPGGFAGPCRLLVAAGTR